MNLIFVFIKYIYIYIYIYGFNLFFFAYNTIRYIFFNIKLKLKRFKKIEVIPSKLFWQYPVITEKAFYNQNKNSNNYVDIPWATLIDKYDLDNYYNSLKINKNFNKNSNNLYTCCQHISFRRLIKIWKILGINRLLFS